MPLITFRLKYTGPVPGVNLGLREWNNLKKEAWRATGVYWHVNILKKHFTKAGGREYGYTPRSGEPGTIAAKHFWWSYTGWKLRETHQTEPLVFTAALGNAGSLRDGCKTAGIYPTGQSVRVTLPNAQKANLQSPRSNINMRDELTRFSDEDIEVLTEVWQENFEKLLDGVRTVQIRDLVAGMTLLPQTQSAMSGT